MPQQRSNLSKALDLLDKQGKRNPGRLSLARIATGLVGFDKSIGGGLVRGRIYEVAGNETAGKTTLALECVKAVQGAGMAAVFLDFEHALDVDYAKSMGVDTGEDKWVFDQPKNLEDGMLVGYELIKSGSVGIVVVDSVAAMAPGRELEGDAGPAQQARALGPVLRKYVGMLSETATIGFFLNQVRVDFGKWGGGITTPGGKALKYYASVRLFVSAGKSKVYDDGIRAKVRVWKNKTSPDQRGVSEHEIRPMVGVVREEELLDAGKESGIISERGGIFKIKDKTIRGREKMVEFLKDKRVQEWVSKMILGEARGVPK